MFIKLTDHKNNKPIYVNKAYVSLVYTRRSENGEVTVVELAGLGTAIIKVNESVEEVMELLGNILWDRMAVHYPKIPKETLQAILDADKLYQKRKE